MSTGLKLGNEKRETFRPCFARWRKILELLDYEGTVTATRFAIELETSRKTIYRDMDFLRDQMELPIEATEAGYRLTGPITSCPFCKHHPL